MRDAPTQQDRGISPQTHRGAAVVQERWYETLLAHSSDLIAVLDDQARVLYANPAAERLLGFVPEEQLGKNMLELVHPDDLEAIASRFSEVKLRPGSSPPAIFRFQSASGEWKVLEATSTNCLDDPDIRGIVLNARDVTEQTAMSRAIRTLSEGNDVLVHATDETSLLADTCRAIVTTGGYALAWVGYAEHDEGHRVSPVAAAGRTEYLSDLPVGWGDDELGRGPTGMAIRTRCAQVLNDMHRSKSFVPWREAADSYGFRGSCALPLVVRDETVGALMIYAGEPEVFGPDEVAILSELADDLAYGIGRLRDASRLAHNEALLREAERLARVGHWDWDLESGRVEFMADEIFTIHGIDPASWKGTCEALLDLVHLEDRHAFREAIDRALACGTAEVEHRIVRPNGEVCFVRERAEVVLGN
ncbi:MAG: PAS domain-containing protein, partial [Acidimicrobiales bacterium]